LPGFDIGNDLVKVSLAYILDKICQAKNFKISGAKVYDKQALVIIAEPGTKAVDVIDLSKKLISQVKNMTNIDIECEVEWVV
jgi:UDP-N-acetylenolpyruvoylglucosamine reductase